MNEFNIHVSGFNRNIWNDEWDENCAEFCMCNLHETARSRLKKKWNITICGPPSCGWIHKTSICAVKYSLEFLIDFPDYLCFRKTSFCRLFLASFPISNWMSFVYCCVACIYVTIWGREGRWCEQCHIATIRAYRYSISIYYSSLYAGSLFCCFIFHFQWWPICSNWKCNRARNA